ncbi:hypothetical protein J2S09_004398 [Bacillus fengqiuensis]|nr:hypothetical protein [Bacillus fengqiuensis]
MTDNNKEIYEPKIKQEKDDNQAKREAVMKLTSDLLKDETSIDMGSIMNMATSLLKNDKLMGSVKDLAKLNQTKAIGVPQQTPKQKDQEMASPPVNMEELIHGLTMLKQELQDIKEQNEHLKELILKQEKRQVKKESERDQQLILLMEELKETKGLMAAIKKKKK